MDLSCKFIGQNRIDHTVTLQPGLPREDRRNHAHGEVALARSRRTSMARMVMGVIDDFQDFGREGGGQFLFDDLFDAHSARHSQLQVRNLTGGREAQARTSSAGMYLIGQSIAIVIVEPSLLCPITIPIMPVT